MLYIFYTKYIILGLTAKVKYRHISVPKEQTYQTVFLQLPASQNQMMMFHSVSSVKLIRESTLSSMLLFLKK